ncbi:sortase [Pontiellaceae bacterium B12227]|nr:sortase [Pontiellaceae bacterium B12227]
MRRKLWIVLLALGLAISARPAASRVKRGWIHWSASRVWNACRQNPGGGGAGEPCGWLKIPTIGIQQLVLEGAAKDRLALYPCAERVGRSRLIMAHRDTHFMGLGKVRVGDPIQLEQRGGAMQLFECEAVYVVEKEEARALIEKFSAKDRLLLLTCYPFRYIGPAPKRFIVVARASAST